MSIEEHNVTLQYECPHCKTAVEISDQLLDETIDCPNCSKPFSVRPPAARMLSGDEVQKRPQSAKGPLDDEETLHVAHPAVFRRHIFGTLLCLILVIGGVVLLAFGVLGYQLLQFTGLPLIIVGGVALAIGLLLLAKWAIERHSESLIMTSERIIYRKGIFHRDTSEIRHDDVRNLQVEQNFIARMLNFGDLAISSAGQDDMEIVARDIVDPEGLADAIRRRQ